MTLGAIARGLAKKRKKLKEEDDLGVRVIDLAQTYYTFACKCIRTMAVVYLHTEIRIRPT